MNKRTAPLAIVAMSVAALVAAPVAQAQDTAAPAATPASTPKQIKKAERKAARAKKNAELKELEKNGYNPAGEQTDYPQNLQNAQSKINAQKAGKPAPASAP
ncbi:hypothetical protein AWB75_00964 [Caballeronia catudaia]|uniref:Purine nucleoside phosphorylase n=1 Tax=Caballeronia catudaia TaxID=1777136 RepID=A0A157ZME4_9BURK|nr:DUF4148 domain-containing protein [Caballeronia catudaia]SAK46685.1 hypothetical protein AWB75_00964 [Caballeronia catudaia]